MLFIFVIAIALLAGIVYTIVQQNLDIEKSLEETFQILERIKTMRENSKT